VPTIAACAAGIRSPGGWRDIPSTAVPNRAGGSGPVAAADRVGRTSPTPAALAIENVDAFRQLDEAWMETLQRLGLAAEYRDDATREHAGRVAS
jgi:hypothetical protein